MYIKIYKDEFIELFKKYGRENNFKRSSLALLFDYFEEFEEDFGDKLVIDIIAICCDYSEIELTKVNDEFYSEDYSMSLNDLLNHTTVLYDYSDQKNDSMTAVIRNF